MLGDVPRKPEVSELERIRRISLALPEATERLSHGSPSFFVRDKKVFVMFIERHRHHQPGLAIWCKAADGVQAELVDAEPHRFFKPPYVGPSGWIGVRLDVEVDWAEVEAIVTDSYRLIAPKRLSALLA
jgi:hypothetical protein